MILLAIERQIVFGKIVKLAIKDEQKYYQLLAKESRTKMKIFPYHIQVRKLHAKIKFKTECMEFFES